MSSSRPPAGPQIAAKPTRVVPGDALDRDLPFGLHHQESVGFYYRWQAEMFARRARGVILEHGAGAGGLSAALLQRGLRPLVLTEPTPQLATILRNTYGAQKGVEVFEGTIEEYLAEHGSASVDTIVSSNVLEHIEDDVGCLTSMHKLLRPGGCVALYVPARPELYGPYDAAVGHVRRYTTEELDRKLRQAGFSVISVAYRNLVGALGWFVDQKILGRKDIGNDSIWIYDRVVLPLATALEERVSPGYGLNILAYAFRPSDDGTAPEQ